MEKYRAKGQSTLEYALLVAIIAAGLIGMQFYMKRAFQGRAKQAAEEISEPYDSELMRRSSIATTVQTDIAVDSDSRTVNTGDPDDEEYEIESHITQHEEVNKVGSERLDPW